VKSIEQLPDGTLLVDYEGSRRFKLLLVDDDRKPYLVSTAVA
jgi:Lon protease-like protein